LKRDCRLFYQARAQKPVLARQYLEKLKADRIAQREESQLVFQYNSLFAQFLEREPRAGKLSWHKGLLDEDGV